MKDNKLSVATRTRDFQNKSEKIIRCLTGYPEGLSPKQIALKTRINVNTVKSLIPKIRNIRKINRGLYKVLNKGDGTPSFPLEIQDWNFHNCILSLDDATPSFEKRFEYGLVSLDVSVSAVGRATCRISTDYPMNVSSLSFVASFFAELFGKNIGDVVVSTIEFNHDYSNLRLDGVQSISVDNLITQFKVYQKERGLRFEHKTKVPMSAQNIVEMLSSTPNMSELNVRLTQQKEALGRLMNATESNTQLMLKLIDKIGGNMKNE